MNIQGLEGMRAEAERFVCDDLLERRESATVVALSGELGAGKTTFAQGVARALGVEDKITSPTFVIEKIYALPAGRQALKDQVFARLIHIDAYRLNDAHELAVLGWQELVADPSNLILIEWPERVPGLIPHDAIRVALSGADDSREITYN